MKTYSNNFLESVINGFYSASHNAIEEALARIQATSSRGGRIYLLGNGTSFGLAGIFASDLNKVLKKSAFRIPATAEELTAWANDSSFEQAYALALEHCLQKYDIVCMISCSGNSGNLIQAGHVAQSRAIPVIAITGNPECSLAQLATIHISTPAASNECIECIHMIILKSMIAQLKTQCF